MHDTSRTVHRIKSRCASQWNRVPRPLRSFLAFIIFAAVWWQAHILDLNDAHPGSFPCTGAVVWITLTAWFVATWPKKK